MCLMLYLATSDEQPLRRSPELSVEKVEPSREAVRQWFSLPIVRFIGAHTGCSCGFPHVVAEEPIEYWDGMFRRPGPGGRSEECGFSAGSRSRTCESDRGSAVVSGLGRRRRHSVEGRDQPGTRRAQSREILLQRAVLLSRDRRSRVDAFRRDSIDELCPKCAHGYPTLANFDQRHTR